MRDTDEVIITHTIHQVFHGLLLKKILNTTIVTTLLIYETTPNVFA